MFKENIKQFFGPSWKGIVVKFIFGLVLFVAIIFIQAMIWNIADYSASGWPFYFSESWGPCPLNTMCDRSNALALIVDIVLPYFVVCLVVFLFRKVKERK